MKDNFSNVIKLLKLNRKPVIRKIHEKRLLLLPKVFDPMFFDSRLLAKTIKNLNSSVDSVLDMGTGCGIQVIFIAKYAKKITATDINSFALENAKLNVELHKLEKKVNLIKSDLFSNVSQKFDLIIFNPPFFSKRPKDIIEMAVTDYKNSLLDRFFRNAKDFLNKDGKIIMAVSDIMDINSFNRLIKDSGFNFEVLNKAKFEENNYFVYLIQ